MKKAIITILIVVFTLTGGYNATAVTYTEFASQTALRADANLRQYSKLESVTTDVGMNWTNVNSVTFAAGQFNNAATVGTGNTNKKLTIATTSGITTNFSTSFWFKTNQEISAGTYGLVSLGLGTAHVSVAVHYDYNGGTRRIRFGRSKHYIGANYIDYNLTAGTTWHCIVAFYNGTNLNLFVDGASSTPVAVSGNGNAGADVDGHSLFFDVVDSGAYGDSSIDDVTIFNRALTVSEAQSICASTPDAPTVTNSSNIINFE